MINLIPNEEKKNKVKGFYFRFIISFFIVLACFFSVASIVVFPSLYLSMVKKNVISEKLLTQKNLPLPEIDKELSSQINLLNSKLALVENAQKKKYVISEKIINEIILKKISDIKLNQIVYQVDATAGRVVTVRGVAKSRERLLLFRKILEENPSFKRVELPISNFVKGSDIVFNLKLFPF